MRPVSHTVVLFVVAGDVVRVLPAHSGWTRVDIGLPTEIKETRGVFIVHLVDTGGWGGALTDSDTAGGVSVVAGALFRDVSGDLWREAV